MLKRMPSRLFAEWMAFYRIEPFGELRGDYRAGLIASTLAEIHRDKKKRSRPFSILDFVPKFGMGSSKPPTSKKQTVEQQRSAIMAIAKAFGVKKKDDKGATK